MKRSLMRAFWGWLGKKLGMQFLAGIIVVVPISATILILVWAFNSIDHILQPIIQIVWGSPVTGVGFGIMVVLIYLVGVIASNIVGKRLIHYFESTLPWLPVVRQLYTVIKEFLESFTGSRNAGFMRVVLLEFPRKGMKAVGFVTNELYDETGKKLLNVFIPQAPIPTTGFLQIVGEDEVINTDISVENALKMVVSAGKVSPKEVRYKLSPDA